MGGAPLNVWRAERQRICRAEVLIRERCVSHARSGPPAIRSNDRVVEGDGQSVSLVKRRAGRRSRTRTHDD